MANQQLVDYIKSQLGAGVTKPDLQQAITVAGWTMQDSADAFAVAEGKVPPAPTPSPVQQPKPGPAQPLRPAASSHDPGPSHRFDTVRGPFGWWILYFLGPVIIIGAAV